MYLENEKSGKSLFIYFSGTGDFNRVQFSNYSALKYYIGSDRKLDGYVVTGCGHNTLDFIFPKLELTAKILADKLRNPSDLHSRYNNRISENRKKGRGNDSPRLLRRFFSPIGTTTELVHNESHYDNIILSGFSRGCFSAVFLAKQLSKFMNPKKICLFCFDPVPGNMSSYFPRSISSQADCLQSEKLRFVFFGVGNYLNKIPSMERYVPKISPFTEVDIALLEAKNHVESLDDRDEIILFYLKQFRIIGDLHMLSNVPEEASIRYGLGAFGLHRVWGNIKQKVAGFPITNSESVFTIRRTQKYMEIVYLLHILKIIEVSFKLEKLDSLSFRSQIQQYQAQLKRSLVNQTPIVVPSYIKSISNLIYFHIPQMITRKKYIDEYISPNIYHSYFADLASALENTVPQKEFSNPVFRRGDPLRQALRR